MHHGRDVAFHEMRFIAVTADQVGQFLVADAGTSRWRALLGDAAPAPRVEGRSCGRLTGPLLGGVLAEHGLDDLGDELHDVSLAGAAPGAPGGRFSFRGLCGLADRVVFESTLSCGNEQMAGSTR